MGIWTFRLFGFPVVVEPWFWLIALMLGGRSPAMLPAWVAAVFISVLAHELGHAWLGRAYGLSPSIRLHGFGGVTLCPGRRLTLLQSALLSLAGPVAGFAFGAVIYALTTLAPFEGRFLSSLAWMLVYISIAWGVLNLLPIPPLDGGNIMRQVVYGWTGRADEVLVLRIAIAVGTLVTIAAFAYDTLWTAILLGFITYENYQTLRRLIPHSSYF